MITWFAITQIVVAVAAAILCLVEYAKKRVPDDLTLGAEALLGLLLLAQTIIAAAAPAFGNFAVGDPLEFWMYLIVALLLPFGAGFWALVDRKRNAFLVLTVVNLAVAVMVYRMLVIWHPSA
ncbi:MAG: hypothetical protein LCH36_09205 [Actinobacteria bacterium]|jgi:hypothetical protein|nr:hypothetical protein [Actinomycetota bacterium]